MALSQDVHLSSDTLIIPICVFGSSKAIENRAGLNEAKYNGCGIYHYDIKNIVNEEGFLKEGYMRVVDEKLIAPNEPPGLECRIILSNKRYCGTEIMFSGHSNIVSGYPDGIRTNSIQKLKPFEIKMRETNASYSGMLHIVFYNSSLEEDGQVKHSYVNPGDNWELSFKLEFESCRNNLIRRTSEIKNLSMVETKVVDCENIFDI